MKKLSILTNIIILMFVIRLFMPHIASAEETKNTPIQHSISILMFDEDQKFSQPKNSTSYWFNIPNGTELNDCNINLHMNFSKTLIDDRSNLSILINDSPVDTKWINVLKTTKWWKVTIPVSKLKVNAFNEIKIQSNQRSIEGDCADIDNSSNWMIIYKDTFIEFTINKKYSDALLSNFYQIYGDNLINRSKLSSDFVLAKIADERTISTFLNLSSSMGKLFKDKKDLDYNVAVGSSDNKSFRNKIFLGPINQWSNSSQLSLPTELGPSQGFISIQKQLTQEAIATTNDNTVFNTLITGENQEGINKAINFLANQQLMDQINKNSLVISSETTIKRTTSERKADGHYKFSEFGYGNINLAGAFHQNTYFTFLQPDGIQSAKGSYINIKFNHSKMLVSDRSIITVYVNGIAINSEQLSSANAEGGTLKVIIPEEALKSRMINVGIECYNYLGTIDCSKDYGESAWTVISSGSEICLLPGNIVIQPNLNSFPLFNIKQGKEVTQLVLGLQDSLSGSMLKAASLIASRAGQTTDDLLSWNISQSNILTSDQEKMDIIYLGSYNTINLPESIKNQLYVVPLGDGTFSIRAGLQLLPETLKDKVVFQAVRSPWDATKRLYVVMYDSDENIKTLEKVLSNGDLLNKMSGQIAVVDSDSEITNYIIEEVNEDSPKELGGIVQYIENLTHLPWWLLLTIFIVLALGIIALVRHMRKNYLLERARKAKDQQEYPNDDLE